MAETLLELAEEPSLALPTEPGHDLLEREGYLMGIRGSKASIERIRLGDVERAVEDARVVARERGLESVTWWVGERSTPPGLAEQLLALGLEPDQEMPVARTLTIAREPNGTPIVEVRPVETADDYLRVREIGWAIWPKAPNEPNWRDTWAALVASGRSTHHLALLDGAPAGFGRSVFTPSAALLMGGAVLPQARGRGVYTSLVHARWREAVERGVPRLLVGAGRMSAPILDKLGFEELGRIQLLRDRL